MLSIIRNYAETKSPISHKYLNHGKLVPTQKCFKFNNRSNINYIRFYSTKPSLDFTPVKLYDDAFSPQARKLIIKDNKNKSGIYK